MGTRERINGGVLGVVTVMVTDAAQARRFLALQAAGQAQRFSGWAEWVAPGFEIRSACPVAVGVDGEALIMDPPLVFRSRPAALRVRLPRRTLRRSPAARTVHVLSRSTLTSLARVAAGVSPGSAGPGSAGGQSRPAPAPPPLTR